MQAVFQPAAAAAEGVEWRVGGWVGGSADGVIHTGTLEWERTRVSAL